jgi:hypothetical protein
VAWLYYQKLNDYKGVKVIFEKAKVNYKSVENLDKVYIAYANMKIYREGLFKSVIDLLSRTTTPLKGKEKGLIRTVHFDDHNLLRKIFIICGSWHSRCCL